MDNENQRTSLRLILPVFIIALVCSLIISVADMLTGDRIEKNKQQTTINIIEAVMPLAHNNDLYEDRMQLPELSTTVYRARQDEKKIGLVFMPIAANGYNGQIKLAVGVSYDGILSGVRVVEQHETRGLGDRIDQNNSDWIFNFDKRSLSNTPDNAWAVNIDGGDFDQLSGATISPRGVINAVKNILEFYTEYRDDLYN